MSMPRLKNINEDQTVGNMIGFPDFSEDLNVPFNCVWVDSGEMGTCSGTFSWLWSCPQSRWCMYWRTTIPKGM